jgi:hypothetical protein
MYRINAMLKLFPIILFVLFSLVFFRSSLADEITGKTIEPAIWQRYENFNAAVIIDQKTAKLYLQRIGDNIDGYWSHEQTSFRLTGKLDETTGKFQLNEDSYPPPVIATWDGVWQKDAIHVTRKKNDDSQTLTLKTINSGTTFPYAMDLLFREAWSNQLPNDDSSLCNNEPSITSIKLTNFDGSAQILDNIDSQGTCGLFTPDILDLNFDGHDDIMLAITLPAGPNIPYTYWLFNPRTKQFEINNALAELTSPEVDSVRKRLIVTWRGGAGLHGVNVYEWKKGKLVTIMEKTSYFKKMHRGPFKGKTCYFMTSYDVADGKIKVFNSEDCSVDY